MLRALQTCLVLVGIVTVGLVVALGLGRTAQTQLPPGFDACPLPCFAGIVPGVTSIENARRALETLTQSRGSETAAGSQTWVYSTQTAQYRFQGGIAPAGDMLLAIDSIQQPALITLGDTLRLLGPPDSSNSGIFWMADPENLVFCYNRGTYKVLLRFKSDGVFGLNTRADTVQIMKDGQRFRGTYRWRGLGALTG
jgi:hypothetical protein